MNLPNRARHIRHERTVKVRIGSFAGFRRRTEIERCQTCGGLLLSVKLLLSVNQTDDRRRA